MSQSALAGKKQRRSAVLILAVFLVLLFLVPGLLALGDLGMAHLRPAFLIGSVALMLLLCVLPSLLPSWLASLLVTLLFGGMLFVRLWLFGLSQFSGMGFTSEVFIHLEWKSVQLAWEQFRGLFVLLLVVLAAMPLAIGALVGRVPRFRRPVAAGIAAVAVLFAGLFHQAQPEWMLGDAMYAWYGPKSLDLPESELQRWRESGLVEVDLPKKSAIHAHAPETPKNLILVYLESLGVGVIDHPDYPGLMPNLSRRVATQNLVPDYFAGSYITIEGITNSQCGTLFPFDRGSESLAGSDGMAEQQVCLGDVLAKVGYQQSYLGGADVAFAGKGNFLASHGYDAVRGYGYWQEIGLKRRSGGWGLGDPDLFEQALVELEELRASKRPFNLTLLTIGTHLPGYTYEECEPYGSEEFIEALHCADQLLENWLQQLEDQGYLEDTLVVITADHHVFPNPEMRRLFGDEAIINKRLPLVVLGADASQPVLTDVGMNYDLAPTILDLLGIDHNAHFALGRSLLRPEARREYFPTRYQDVFQREYAPAKPGDCSSDAPDLPLVRCEKDALMTLLRMQNDSLSMSMAAQMECGKTDSNRIIVPDEPSGPLRFFVGGEDQAQRFTWRSRVREANSQGLFAAIFSADGTLQERRFIPFDEPQHLREFPASLDGRSAWLVWRSEPEHAVLPEWARAEEEQPQQTAMFIDAEGAVHPLIGNKSGEDTVYVIAPDVCETAFE